MPGGKLAAVPGLPGPAGLARFHSARRPWIWTSRAPGWCAMARTICWSPWASARLQFTNTGRGRRGGCLLLQDPNLTFPGGASCGQAHPPPGNVRFRSCDMPSQANFSGKMTVCSKCCRTTHPKARVPRVERTTQYACTSHPPGEGATDLKKKPGLSDKDLVGGRLCWRLGATCRCGGGG